MSPCTDLRAFGPDFHFGAATSAYQIEGAVHAGGRGRSIWDDFCDRPGQIADGSSGAVACDHHRRWRDDLDLMQAMGLSAYRFSIAWPRVLPLGRGAVNAAGLDFYDRLVDGLLERGIAPYVTLYHWDLPSTLAAAGGWRSRTTAEAFAAFAEAVARRLGDRVHRWATLNEPRCSAFVGHLEGRHAPGQRSLPAALEAAHHLLLAHGLGTQAIRACLPAAKVGLVLDLKPHVPATAAQADVDAARRGDGVFNRWFLDPVFRGAYPEDMRRWFEASMPAIGPDDLRTIATPIDSLGVNYYTRAIVRHADGQGAVHLQEVAPPPRAHRSRMGWEDHPQGLHDILTRLADSYRPPEIYVAENGCAEDDQPTADGRVPDPDRVRYLTGHLDAAARARRDGVPLKAYFAWSLLDNFEWGHGYRMRFGLVHVDFGTQQRRWKDSAHVYRDLIAQARDAGGGD